MMNKKLIVNVSVTDLRREPIPAGMSYEQDLLQESQLLYGEHLIGVKENADWYYIEAPGQQKFTAEGWKGYPGWVKKAHVIEVKEFINKYTLIVHVPWSKVGEIPVSLGTRLFGLSQKTDTWQVRLADGSIGEISKHHVRHLTEKQAELDPTKRQDLLDKGMQLLGQPYLWGGFSAYNPQFLSSCDCSGFVGLLYRLQGINLARDAHDQYLQCKKLAPHEMLPGDLIFLSKAQRMGHVMLYVGGDAFMDANITDRKTVQSTAQERFGRPFAEMSNGELVGKYYIHFGRV